MGEGRRSVGKVGRGSCSGPGERCVGLNRCGPRGWGTVIHDCANRIRGLRTDGTGYLRPLLTFCTGIAASFPLPVLNNSKNVPSSFVLAKGVWDTIAVRLSKSLLLMGLRFPATVGPLRSSLSVCASGRTCPSDPWTWGCREVPRDLIKYTPWAPPRRFCSQGWDSQGGTRPVFCVALHVTAMPARSARDPAVCPGPAPWPGASRPLRKQVSVGVARGPSLALACVRTAPGAGGIGVRP